MIRSVKSPYKRQLVTSPSKKKGNPNSISSLENKVMIGNPNTCNVSADKDKSKPDPVGFSASEKAAKKLPLVNIPIIHVEVRNVRKLNFFIEYQG